MVASIRILLIQTTEKMSLESGEICMGINAGDASAVNDEFMFPPPTALWKGIDDGRTILPEFTLANMMNYFVTRKVCDEKSLAILSM